jgi:hypothetical protein
LRDSANFDPIRLTLELSYFYFLGCLKSLKDGR